MIYQHFKNFSEFWQFAASEMLPEFGTMERSSQRIDDRIKPWSGTRDYAEVERLNREGWPEGVERVNKVLAQLGTFISGFVPVYEWQHTIEPSFEIDVGAFVNGEHEVFLEQVELDDVVQVEISPRLVRIVYNICVSAALSAEEMFYRGAAITAIAQVLEMRGIQTRIDVVAANRVSEGLETWITVKDYGEIFDLDRVTFMVSHPAVFRRMIFSCWEHLPDSTRRAFGFGDDGGYGKVGDTKDKGDIYLAGHERGTPADLSSTIEWVKEHLSQFGIELDT